MFSSEEMFFETFWETCTEAELRELIMKFASLEARTRKSDETNIWKERRLNSVGIFEKRYGKAPSKLLLPELPEPFGSILFDEELKQWK